MRPRTYDGETTHAGTKLVVIGGWSGRENYGQSLADVFLLEVGRHHLSLLPRLGL
jgi:hypothetical protein